MRPILVLFACLVGRSVGRQMALAPLAKWNQSKVLHHIHIEKCGGTSVDSFFQQEKIVDHFHGFKHFDASCVEDGGAAIFVARDPTTRAISKFNFVKGQPWTKAHPDIRAATTLTALARVGRGRLFWRDGDGLGLWLSGAYPKRSYRCADEGGLREMTVDVAEKALAFMARATWFGIMERPGDSDALFSRVFGRSWAAMPKKNGNRRHSYRNASVQEDRSLIRERQVWDWWLYAGANAIYDARLRDRAAFEVPEYPSSDALAVAREAFRRSQELDALHGAEDRAALDRERVAAQREAAAASRARARAKREKRREKRRSGATMSVLRFAPGFLS